MVAQGGAQEHILRALVRAPRHHQYMMTKPVNLSTGRQVNVSTRKSVNHNQ